MPDANSSTYKGRTLNWELFLSEVLPTLLAGTGVDSGESAAIVGDTADRARDYAASGRAARRALRVPFVDDVADFLPSEAPTSVKADTAVVVRNSRLEDSHSAGAVEDRTITEITYLATGALNVWLREHSSREENLLPAGVFDNVADHPRAYAALQALALAAETGGREAFRVAANAGETPLLSAGGHAGSTIKVRRSGLSDIDDGLRAMLSSIVEGNSDLLFTSSLSRYSRDSATQALVVETVLAHGGAILTTNFLLRPGEVFARRPPFVAANSHDPLSVLSEDRLTRLHAKFVRRLL